jgi:16S rRNA (guanine(966)-N(2))-methyltransferase RsmD
MRIIGGEWRSRRLLRPKTTATRPVPDRVRESVFSFLGSHFECPGEMPAITVADVFAGSGSMGLEALSRGAAMCCFFERDRAALATLRRNIHALQATPRAMVVMRDAWWSSTGAVGGQAFDLVLLDPPYVDSQDASERGRVAQYLARLTRSDHGEQLVALHHCGKIRFDTAFPGWSVLDQRVLGSNGLTFFSR